MRNVIVALGSFMLGVLFASLLGFGIPHASIVRQSVAAAQSKPPAPASPVSKFDPNPFTPIVPAPPRSFSEGNIFVNRLVQLDGRNSHSETFHSTTIVYGGGAYIMQGAVIDGIVNVQLIGAAANTAQFLAMLGMLGCPASSPKAPPRIDNNTPTIQKISLAAPITGDLFSPYNGIK
jgi:hypothetical protein